MRWRRYVSATASDQAPSDPFASVLRMSFAVSAAGSLRVDLLGAQDETHALATGARRLFKPGKVEPFGLFDAAHEGGNPSSRLRHALDPDVAACLLERSQVDAIEIGRASCRERV